jgi:hypothetical protein
MGSKPLDELVEEALVGNVRRPRRELEDKAVDVAGLTATHVSLTT